MSKVMKNVNLHKEIYLMQGYKHQQPCYVLIIFLHFLLYVPYTLDLTAPTTREHFFCILFAFACLWSGWATNQIANAKYALIFYQE